MAEFSQTNPHPTTKGMTTPKRKKIERLYKASPTLSHVLSSVLPSVLVALLFLRDLLVLRELIDVALLPAAPLLK